MTLMDLVSEKVVEGYALSRYHAKFDKFAVQTLFRLFPDRFCSYKETVVVFLRLSDDSFGQLLLGVLDLCDPKVLMPLFKEEGDNVHVLGVVSNSVRDMLFLRRYLQGTTLSWYVPDMSRLVVFERR